LGVRFIGKINLEIFMNKKIIFSLVLAVAPANVFAADNVGGCGWGSKLFTGQKGVFPQILAVTTNGTSGNQTFGISSGTSGCSQDGMVTSAWKTAAYVDGNMNKLALDLSRGEGESLDSLAQLVGVDAADRAEFALTLKENFSTIFPSESVTSEQVVVALRGVVASNADLAKYAAQI
jgi:Protein of unknown function (DUF3015)